MDLKFEFTNGKIIEEALNQLPRKLKNKVLRKALRQGGNILLRKARAYAPVKTGALRRGIKLRIDLRGTPSAIINVRIPSRYRNKAKGAKGGPYYSTFIELGTRKMAARPFLRPAFDASKEQALAKFLEVLNDGIEEQAKTL